MSDKEATKPLPPIPDSVVGLQALVGALEKACFYVEHETRLLGTQPVLRTSVIRKLIKEHTKL